MRVVSKVSFPKFVYGQEWTEWNQINGKSKFWVAGYTIKISSRMVQYVARYQYTNMERVIKIYGAAEVRSIIRFYTVRNHSTTEIHEKLCAVYEQQCNSPPYTAHNFSIYPSHDGFVWCKIVLCFELPQHCTCLHTSVSRCTVLVNLKFLQCIQQLKT